MKNLINIFAVLAVAGFVGSQQANALPYAYTPEQGGSTAFDGDILASSLINTNALTLGSFSYTEGDYQNNPPTGANDGVGGDNFSNGVYLVNGSFPETFTFTLTGSVTGYDITSMNSIAGWSNNDDGSQDVTISYETVASALLPVADQYTVLGNFDLPSTAPFDDSNGGNPDNGTEVHLAEAVSGVPILTNVIGLKFLYVVPDNANATILHEVEVFGGASAPALVPEPSTYALLLAGAALLVARFRRRNA